ncbi:MAG: LysR family transcriptional regulator [Octadecabacter sp.]|nr:LysR family transcriptional regulator [Octadecabacter sp.]
MLLPHRSRFLWNADWNLLRTFTVFVGERGISKAAVFLGLKQPTISSALQRLEQAVGKTIVICKPNVFTVTCAGQVCIRDALWFSGKYPNLRPS